MSEGGDSVTSGVPAPLERLVGYDEIARLAAVPINCATTIVVQRTSPGSPLEFVSATGPHGRATDRNATSTKYIIDLLRYCDDPDLLRIDRPFRFLFQGDDNPVDVPSLAWQRRSGFAHVRVLPDFYYTEAAGYEDFLPDGVADWGGRAGKAIWRGSTTGALGLTLASLATLPRYRLCRFGADHPDITDFGLVAVCQAASTLDQSEITARLEGEGMLKSFIPLEQYAKYKLMIHIDGNGNSWELVKKARLGCCMLSVASEWELWHDRHFNRWQHVLPIRSDLGDLAQTIRWCLEHDDEARAMAASLRQRAMAISFQSEMTAAAAAAYDFIKMAAQTDRRVA